ncbi:MAG: GDPmannose 4,6-dehydratase, partial [Acidobacteriota bacterium]|nr:GDPmannose 4,6-dehydratase [Acidobacteriota bacterium]
MCARIIALLANGTALIFGVSGQDGAYLSRLLLGKGYAVHGVSRDPHRQPFARLHALGIRERVVMHQSSMRDGDELRRLLDEVQPDEIYNLAGLTSVAQSFDAAETAAASIAGAHQLLLRSLRLSGARSRLYHAASSDCFGDLEPGTAADESTPFAPRSPYAAAKAEAHRLTVDYRERFGLYAVSALVCNHESPLRGEQFVTSKVVAAAAAASRGTLAGKLHLGDLSVCRDWGYAPEYVDAMWRMLQQEQPADYVIATGESHSVEELVAAAFTAFGLEHRDYVVSDPTLLRPADIRYSRGNPTRAREHLGWQAQTRFADLVQLLADAAR